jgi:hypothetical protein
MSAKKPDLATLLADSAGSTRKKSAPAPIAASKTAAAPRKGVRPITVHFPQQVREQIKILAVERHTTMQNVIAEAYNDLFAKYGKPEIAPNEKTQ